MDRIQSVFHETGGVLGHRGMRVFLSREGIQLSKTTIHKYMNKELELYCTPARSKPKYHYGQQHAVFPNLVEQNFKVKEKNLVWCTDFTYIKCKDGKFRYNCSVLDLYDRSIVATKTSLIMNSSLAIETPDAGLKAQQEKPKNLIVHSDQGSQYSSYEFIEYCKNQGITQSMSKAGCPYDNAVMERFFKTMKFELIHRYQFQEEHHLSIAISEYAFGWYNQVRPHTSNGYMTPNEMRYF